MLYHLYELNHAALAPARAMAKLGRRVLSSPENPLAGSVFGKSVTASFDMFERTTRRYGKPEFNLSETKIAGESVAVREEIIWQKPFCRLLHFKRDLPNKTKPDPKVLMVAPMSGHYASLLRGTVEALLPDHDIYITDWVDAREVPLGDGDFGLDDYVDYLIEMLHALGEHVHVIAVCQPSVPVLAAVSLMSDDEDRFTPASMTLMGGPVDTRINPTAVNKLAVQRGTAWFKRHVITRVPFPNPGLMRQVYPGFLQLSGFMSMNPNQHLQAHKDLFMHLVRGDDDPAEKHKSFYDEYLSVMDLTAEFYLQTIDQVFVEHSLPRGEFRHRGRLIEPTAITNTALLTVEGALDDISGLGQTQAAHDLCSAIPAHKKQHHVEPGVGHYGVFSGSRFRNGIAPRIARFIATHA